MSTDPETLKEAAQKAVGGLVEVAVEEGQKLLFADDTPDPVKLVIEGPETIEDNLKQLDINEKQWEKLERSEAGQVLREAWEKARPFLVAVTGAASSVAFGALAERVSRGLEK